MKRITSSCTRILRNIVIGCLLASVAGVTAAQAYDDDDYYNNGSYARAHERQEQAWRERQAREHRGHWDHRYWNRDREDGYYYRPPGVIYDYPPPPSIGFQFRLR